MTLITDLDTWVAGLATATGLPATRDPDLVNPPCLFVSLPDTVRVSAEADLAGTASRTPTR